VKRSVAALLLVLAAGCGANSPRPIDRPAPPTIAARCGVHLPEARSFWFRAGDGTILDGVAAGNGRTAVVFAHGYPSSLCDWSNLASELDRRGYAVLLFDFRNLGLSDKGGPHEPTSDLAGAVGEARRRGARHVILAGWSYGGTAVVVAAPRLEVDGVVAVSPPPDLSNWIKGLDAVAAVRHLHAPLLVLYAKDDFRTPPAGERALADAAGSKDKRVIQFPGPWHAYDLLYRSPDRERAMRLVLQFVETHAEG
jgi:pimeloyl-ACP methyl ester carboxylesterase